MSGSIFVTNFFAGADLQRFTCFCDYSQGEKLNICYDLYAAEVFTLW